MERISRAEIESSVDSFPDLDYKFEHIDWADIMDAEEASNPEMKLDVLQQKSCSIRTDIFRSTVNQPGLPSLNSLKLDDHSRGLPPLDTTQLRGVNNGSVPMLVSFSGVLNKHKIENSNNNTTNNQFLVNKTPVGRKKEIFKIPALPIQMGKRSLEDSAQSHTDRKAVRLPPSPSSLHDNKRLKISEHYCNRDWKYGDDDFIFTSDLDWRSNRVESFRLPIPHSFSVSTLESDTELETSSAYSDTSSTSTLTSKRSKHREELPLITDPHKLEQRQRQLDYGKNTEGYNNYIKLWPKLSRKLDMPRTPDKNIGYSHRRWLGLMTKWRKALHKWDSLDEPPPQPKSKEFLSHFEDANTFPTLPMDQVATPEVSPEKQFSYSLALQNLCEDIDQSPQQQQQQPAKQTSINNTNTPVSNQPAQETAEVPTLTKPLTYSSVLKVPISVHKTNSPRVTESRAGDEKLVPASGNNAAVSEARDPPTPVDTPTNSTSQRILSSPGASAIKHNSCIDNTMEVDIPPNSTNETLNDKFNTQPLSYSQALKSKPSVYPATMDTNTVETVNELSNNCKEVEKSSTEMESNENPKKSGLTYSQVLASSMLNGPSQETQISNKIQVCSPENTGYNT